MFGVASLTGNSFEIKCCLGSETKKEDKKSIKKKIKRNQRTTIIIKGTKEREKKRLMILHTSQVSSVVRSSD